MNAKLEESNQPVILVEEIIAANLYTGPVRRARARLSPLSPVALPVSYTHLTLPTILLV